ncbi:hypothetical protein ACHAXT_010611 [Thalassiosira profunda]
MASAASEDAADPLPPAPRGVGDGAPTGGGGGGAQTPREREAEAVYALIDGRWRSGADASDSAAAADDGNDDGALERLSIPLPISGEYNGEGGSGGGTSNRSACDVVATTTAAQHYAYYARKYPSPSYLERRNQIMLQELKELERRENRERKKRGWFGWLFSRADRERAIEKLDSSEVFSISTKDSEEEDDNDTIEEEGLVAERVDDGLCGTASFLDNRAVTRESLAFHRFHLASERRALSAPQHPGVSGRCVVIPVRRSVGWDDSGESAEGPHLCVVGYGKIAELPSLHSNSREESGEPRARVTLTSDHRLLLNLGRRNDKPHDFRHVRAARIGNDCLMISWGRGDGWVVFYRRIHSSSQQHKQRGELEVGWRAIAAASPSRPVVQAAAKNLTPDPLVPPEEEASEARDRRLGDSGTLAVSDLVPLVVDSNSSDDQSNNAPSSAVLAVSRLGGYVEFLPLPDWIWRPDSKHTVPQATQGRLPNLSAACHPTAVSTHRDHLDVMCLDAFRTSVGADSERDEKERPEGPPAEVILAASGAGGANATVSLWGITTVHSLTEERMEGRPTFEVRVRSIGSASLDNIGADSSVFLDETAADRWAGGEEEGNPATAGRKRKFPSGNVPLSSVTIPPPVVSLRFTPRGGSKVLLAALDYNGGVSLFDCTATVRVAEYATSGDTVADCTGMGLVYNRDDMMQLATAARASQIEWWSTNPEGSFALATCATLFGGGKHPTSVVRLQQIADKPMDVFSVPISNASASSMALLPMLSGSRGSALSFLQIVTGSDHPCLSVRGMRKLLEPTEIISTLLRRGDPQRALEVAAKFGGAERFGGRVMDECRMTLWEERGDAKALKLVSDDDYVVDQATKLVQCEEGSVEPCCVTLDDLMEVLREALARSDDTSASLLRSGIHRLGTFLLLLSHLGSPNSHEQPSSLARRFLHEFRPESLRSIASCAAAKGDVAALTVLLARHPVSVKEQMELLDLIPLGVDISTYEHLLTCISAEDGHTQQLFEHLCHLQAQNKGRSPSSGLIDLFTDDADRGFARQLLEENANAEDAGAPTIDEVASWYLKRAIDTHAETGQVASTRAVCKAGLTRLGLAPLAGDKAEDNLAVNQESRAVGKLIYLHSAASLFCRILAGKLTGPMSNGATSSLDALPGLKGVFTSVIDFCSMELADSVPFIIGSGDGLSVSAFQKHTTLFTNCDECLGPGGIRTNAGDITSRLERDVMKLCLDKLRALRTERRRVSSQDAPFLSQRLDETLSACVDFASSFGAGVSSAIDFAEEIFQSVLEVTKGDWNLISGTVFDKLWSAIELLAHTASSGSGDGLSRANILYFKLVSLQLCCRWRGRHAIPRELWNFLHTKSSGEGGVAKSCCLAGQQLLSIMCRGFCDMAHDADKDPNLLFDFVSDVDEFDRRFFSAGIQQSGCLGKMLLQPLLSQHSFFTLKGILTIRPEWFSQKCIQSAVSSFLQSDPDASLACREILGPLLPSLASQLEPNEHMSNAKHFMLEAMKLDPLLLGHLFADDYSANPIALVEALMEKNPRALLLGCEFWSEESSSHSACSDATVYFSSQVNAVLNKRPVEDTSQVLPPMPGALVMQLANILGIRSLHDILLVKRCMVMGALNMRLGPAAAAICLSMLCDVAFSKQDSETGEDKSSGPEETQLIDCVAAIVGDESFGAPLIKKEMCTLALCLFTFRGTSLYHGVLDACRGLEYQLLALETNSTPAETGQLSGEAGEAPRSDFLVFRAAGMVARQAMHLVDHPTAHSQGTGRNYFHEEALTHVYSEMKKSTAGDVLQLLSSSSEPSSSNETTLKSLGEVVFSWIASDALKTRSESSPASLPSTHFLAMLELGTSCLREQRPSTAYLFIDRIVEQFKVRVIEAHAHEHSTSLDSSIQADPSIAKRLNDRGYGWNAARRAAIMTNNEGYSAALAWAVQHFQDPDFDAPIYFLRTGGSTNVDQHLIDVTDGILYAIKQDLEEEKRREESTRGAKPTPDPKNLLHSKATPGKLKGRAFVSKLPIPSPRASPLPFIREGGTTKEKSPDARGSDAVEATPLVTNRSQPSKFMSKIPSPTASRVSPVPAATPTKGPATEPQGPSFSGGGSISSVEGSLSGKADVKKQIAAGKAKLGTQNLSLEERKKLAERGRRLLDAARARNKKVVAPPASITTSRRGPS